MIKQNLAIYSIPILHEILKELENDLNFNITYISDKKKLENKIFSNFLVITEKKNSKFKNHLQIIFPMKISKLIEKVNIQFIKSKSKENSNISIGKYTLNVNSRELMMNSNSLNLTEKEVNLILCLQNSVKPINIKNLQRKVWGYRNSLETHTVETHVHRLRKKILSTFNFNDFIKSDKDGYYLNNLSKDV